MGRLACLLALACLIAVPAADASTGVLPAVGRTLTASATTQRDCAAHATTGRGVARTTYRAPMAGFVSVRSAGSDRSDWDVALFDARSKRALAGSAGFGSHELAQTFVSSGQRVLVQGCRQKGGAPSLAVGIRFVGAKPAGGGKASLIRISFPS